jgi:hypothetical protein
MGTAKNWFLLPKAKRSKAKRSKAEGVPKRSVLFHITSYNKIEKPYVKEAFLLLFYGSNEGMIQRMVTSGRLCLRFFKDFYLCFSKNFQTYF